jgi:hypothetical protein
MSATLQLLLNHASVDFSYRTELVALVGDVHPLPGKSEAEQQDAAPTIVELKAKGAVSRGMPDKAKKRSGGRGE